MRQIGVSKFRRDFHALLDNLGGEGIIITKWGRPIAKLTLFRSDCAHLIGSMKGKLKIRGNIFSTGLRWDAEG